MTAHLLKLVESGTTVLGPPPVGAPSLAPGPDAARAALLRSHVTNGLAGDPAHDTPRFLVGEYWAAGKPHRIRATSLSCMSRMPQPRDASKLVRGVYPEEIRLPWVAG